VLRTRAATCAGARMAHHGDADVAGGDAELIGQDHRREAERAAHVDGRVVRRHGGAALAREQLRDEAEADRVLRRLRHREADSQRQQLTEAVHLCDEQPTNIELY